MKKLIRALWLMIVALFATPAVMCDGAVLRRLEYNLADLLVAIAQVESEGDPNAVNVFEDAVGLYQIRPIYVKDCNRILGRPEFKLSDRYDPKRSRLMVVMYITHYGKGKSLEDMARIHNGGPRGHKKAATEAYWKKVKAVLDIVYSKGGG